MFTVRTPYVYVGSMIWNNDWYVDMEVVTTGTAAMDCGIDSSRRTRQRLIAD